MVKLTLILYLLLISFSVFAFQKPSCELLDETDLVFNLNDLDQYYGTMYDTLVLPVPSTLCPSGGTPNNMTWFSFVAGEGVYSIDIVPEKCSGSFSGEEGIQVGVYTDCTFEESIFCMSDCSLSTVTISSVVMIPGEVYYLFLDGCFSSICDFTINIEGNPTYNYPEPTGLVCDLDCDTIYINQQRKIIVEGISNYLDYYWMIPSGVEVLNPLSPPNLTHENSIDLWFPNEGTYTVCLDSASIWIHQTTNVVCKDITVLNNFIASATSSNESSYAANDGTATCMPNGSGVYLFNWSNGEETQSIDHLSPGDYSITVEDTVLNIFAVDTVTVEAFICDSIIMDIDISNNTCFAVCDGSINIVDVLNVTAPYSYNWSNGQTTNEIIGLCAGEYRVTFTDSNN